MTAPSSLNVAIDRSACKGSGPCFVIAPRAFGLDDSMIAVCLDPGAEPEELLFAAAAQCPTQAIYLSRGDMSLYP